MSDFIYLKGRGCPICNGARNDCRKTRYTGLFFCHDNEANPLDYVLVGEDSWGFGIWKDKSEVEAASEEQRQEWRQQRELEKQQRLQEEKKQRSQLLDEPSRDREIRKLLAQLDLSPQHRKNLRDRKLNDQQIELGMFRSVKPFQKLETPVSHRLAGISLDGRSLTNAQPGFICPAWNAYGQIIGWQLRLDDADDGGKYRWATSRGKKRPDGATAHLQTGELPVTICRPMGEPQVKEVGLIEGILKPQVAAQLSGQIMIGAAGGNFAGSPEAVKAYLTKLESENKETSSRTHILYPDAGAITNKGVMQGYRRTRDLLKKLGYELQVAWWNQVSKDDLDYDELLAAGRGDEIRLITWAEFEELARNPNAIRDGFKDLFRNLKQKLDGAFKGFGAPPKTLEKPSQKEKPKPEYLDYVPGKLPLTTEAVVEYQEGQRLEVWQEAVKNDYKHILDVSQTGGGKSYDVGITNPSDFDAQKIVYLATDHRNPSTLSIEENYIDLPVRNDGMHSDPSRKTPAGRRVVSWPSEDHEANIPGNCHRQRLFAKLRSKNLPNVEGGGSPICYTCHLQNACSNSIGLGYGFKKERRETLEASLIRAHPNSIPTTPTDDEKGFDPAKAVFFWDEADALIQPIQVIKVKLTDFNQTWVHLEAKFPEIHDALKPLRLALRPLLTGEVKQPYWGFGDDDIRKILPSLPENLEEILKGLAPTLKADLSPLNVTEKYGVNFADLKDHEQKRFKEKQGKLIEEIENSTLLNWLLPFLRVWSSERGAIRCDYQTLSIHVLNGRHREVANAAKSNIYIDATLTHERLALLLDIDPAEILVVRQKETNHNNVEVIQVTGLKHLGKIRSGSKTARVDALKTALKDVHRPHNEEIGIIEWKPFVHPGDLKWLSESRGSNAYVNCNAVASFGVPVKNLGAAQCEYQVLTGRRISLADKDPDFQEFLDEQVRAEIRQAVGRLRANRRPDEQLIFYFVAEYNLNFLNLPVQQVDAFEITPAAGNRIQQARWVIFQAAKKIAEAGGKLTQDALAATAGFSQGRVSQIAKQFPGGWKALKKLLAALLNSLYSGANNFEGLAEDERFLAEQYLPGLIEGFPDRENPSQVNEDSPADKVERVLEIGKSYGRERLEAILRATSLEVKSKLLTLLAGFLPEEVRNEFHTLADESLNVT